MGRPQAGASPHLIHNRLKGVEINVTLLRDFFTADLQVPFLFAIRWRELVDEYEASHKRGGKQESYEENSGS